MPGDWIRDTAEALAVGRRLGDRVVVIATSTGGTLATNAAVNPAMSQNVVGYVLISPNFRLKPWKALLLDLGYAPVWLHGWQDRKSLSSRPARLTRRI